MQGFMQESVDQFISNHMLLLYGIRQVIYYVTIYLLVYYECSKKRQYVSDRCCSVDSFNNNLCSHLQYIFITCVDSVNDIIRAKHPTKEVPNVHSTRGHCLPHFHMRFAVLPRAYSDRRHVPGLLAVIS